MMIEIFIEVIPDRRSGGKLRPTNIPAGRGGGAWFLLFAWISPNRTHHRPGQRSLAVSASSDSIRTHAPPGLCRMALRQPPVRWPGLLDHSINKLNGIPAARPIAQSSQRLGPNCHRPEPHHHRRTAMQARQAKPDCFYHILDEYYQYYPRASRNP
jgi:hypothetical protein